MYAGSLSHRVNWEFITLSGKTYPVTEGFYRTPNGEDYADAHFDSGHFKSSNKNKPVFSFLLDINGRPNLAGSVTDMGQAPNSAPYLAPYLALNSALSLKCHQIRK